ncbi:hypothetical protein [Pseudooceanicola nanhaiensis]|uniref:hypothetical protein n=1 Tax=Pseudooceanicola nanhaiensis TaxID=375761 RepID=UPI001CD70473|nr:hypothetical protein [Pseudooceanicola nanhaiensis]MCA0922419.1 hypothetical protein [Pseudooceanicola nanhaiensis]
MIHRVVFPLAIALAVSACSGDGTNPFDDDTTTDDTTTDDDGTTIDDRGLPPGTTSPSPNTSITRSEAETETGGGTALNYEYRNDSGQDEFYVDNLPFDADNVYSRGTAVSSLGTAGSYAVYESAPTTTDPSTGTTVSTMTYRAIYGKSTSGQTQFAIVRSASYSDYGFGGFIYKRNATDSNGDAVSLVVPTCSGECTAQYTGDYAGIRVFSGSGGLEYTQGDAEMYIDFEDFNDGQSGVALYVYNRRIYDISGNDVTAAYMTALEAVDDSTTITNTGGGAYMPALRSVISPDNADANGEIVGSILSDVRNSDGTVTELESGNYYAILSGQNAEEVVGVLVVESEDPRIDGVTAQETGGFILYRQ